MSVTINRAALDKALAALADVVDARSTIPILGHVRIVAKDGCLSIYGTDLDMQMVIDVPCDGDLAECCPNFATLKAGASSLVGESVDIKVDAKTDKLTLSAGRANRTIRLLPLADFPVILPGDAGAVLHLPASDLRRALDFVRDAASDDVTRHYLGGVFFEPDGLHLNFVATDGHVMRKFALPIGMAEGLHSVILPSRFAAVICKRGDDGDAEMHIDDKRASYAAGRIRITSKLIDGNFPEYRRVIPTANDKTFEANAEEIARAALAAASVSPEKVRSVKLAMAKDETTFSCTSRDNGGAAVEPVRDASWSEGAFAIGFNAKYLAGTMRCFGDRQIVLAFDDAGAPVLATSATLPEASAVIMPMRL